MDTGPALRKSSPRGTPLVDVTWVFGPTQRCYVWACQCSVRLEEDDPAWHESLGYQRSCCDPCIFCLMDESGPQGHTVIEVDDLATHGNAVHAENMVKLQKTFKFGKWKSIGRTVHRINRTVSMSIRPSLFRRDCSNCDSQRTSLGLEIRNH